MDITQNDLIPEAIPPRLPAEEKADIAIRKEQGVSGPISPRARAFELYMLYNKRPAEIATELQVPLTQIAKWFSSGHWVAKRRDVEQALVDADQHTHKVLVAREKLLVAQEQLKLGKDLEDLVQRVIDESKGADLTPKQLKDLADAAVAATTPRSRVVGISDKLPQEASQVAGSQQPLLIINAPPPQPAGPTHVETIDVEAHETEQ